MKGLFVITGDLHKSLFVEVVIRVLGWWNCGWRNIFLRFLANSINSFEITSSQTKLFLRTHSKPMSDFLFYNDIVDLILSLNTIFPYSVIASLFSMIKNT